MRKPEGYCKDCPDRVAEDPETGARDCHITCEKYKRFKQELADWYRDYNNEKKAAELSNGRPWYNHRRTKHYD